MQFLPFELVAVDLDGTLADEHNRCSPADLRAMHAVAERGAYVVIASGRMHAATERFWHEAELNAPIVSYNGAMIKHPRDKLVWFHLTVPAPCADEIVEEVVADARRRNTIVEAPTTSRLTDLRDIDTPAHGTMAPSGTTLTGKPAPSAT